jgi:uncharacterized protein YecA (UPF0149 family)
MGWLEKLLTKSPVPPERALHLGRNEPCWCNSGKKYKKCHAESDRDYFSRRFAPTCTSGG